MRWVLAATWIAAVVAARTVAAQCQVTKLTAPDAVAADMFGQDVALDGDWALIGKLLDDDIAGESGAAYLFRRVGATWNSAQKLKAADAEFGDSFGYSVALAGDIAVVGALHESPAGVFDAGAAYVFERAGNVWTQTQKLSASDGTASDHFGFDVALSGARILVAAKDDDHAGPSSGSAYVFEKVAGTWIEVTKLVASDASTGDAFGRALAIDGDRVLIGAPSANAATSFDHGAAYVFEFAGTWTQVAKLVASDAVASDFFGVAVELEGPRALIGASAHDHAAANAGAVYAFERLAGSWMETGELSAPDAAAGDQFGASLALGGSLALVGASTDDDQGFSSGSAWALRLDLNGWRAVGKLLTLDAADGDVFGARVALDGDSALVAAVFADDACPADPSCDSGAAYVFDLVPEATQYGSCATLSPCNNVDTHGGCVNSTGAGAVLSACGSSSVALDDLLLFATALPPNAPAIAIVGGGTTNVVFGSGMRVVSAGNASLARLGLGPANALGQFTHGPGIAAQTAAWSAAAQIHAGSKRYFQVWYRDPVGPCGGTTNLSSGLEVVFSP